MKRILLLSIASLAMLMADFTLIGKELTPAAVSKSGYTVVPGVYGFGTDTRAAYGNPTLEPKILHVDTLSGKVSNTDATHGSFRWAIMQQYPRVIVFDVAGIIDIGEADDGSKNANMIEVHSAERSYLTIAGQTAPGLVTILGGGMMLWVNDTLIQHIALRYKSGTYPPTDTTRRSDSGNLLSYSGYKGPWGNHTLDHCSLSWGTDQVMSSSSNVHHVTVSNCIIAEGIDGHSCGPLVYTDNINFTNNLFAHNERRNPQLARGLLAFYNNVVYNHYSGISQMSGDFKYGEAVSTYSLQGNHIKWGPTTQTDPNHDFNHLLLVDQGSAAEDTRNAWMSDSIKEKTEDNIEVVTGFNIAWRGVPDTLTVKHLTEAIDANGYVIKPASQTYGYVLANAGARPADRNPVDTRIINEVESRTGSAPKSVPTLPTYPTAHKAFVSVANPHAMYNEHYTNLEHQLHELAAALEK